MMKGLLFFIKFSWKERKSYIILNAVSQLLIGILPIAIIAIPKYIIDELMEQQRMETMILYVVLLLAAIFINSWGISHVNLLIFNQRCYLSARFSKFMHEKLANTDFCNLEKPDYFEIREKANKFLYGDWHGFSYVLESAFAIVGKVFTLIGIIAIISTMNILIVSIFLLMVLASAFIDSKAKKKSHKLSMEAVKVERRWNYFTRILEDVSYSKEIRMNNMSHWLIDAEAEHEIFQQFDAMIRDKTAIYISHRLSSSRLCDYIAVFQAGHIIEYGTHDELISLDGKYAELYNLQAQYYVDKRVV